MSLTNPLMSRSCRPRYMRKSNFLGERMSLFREPDAGNPPVRFDERCALEVHGSQTPEMASVAKPRQQPRTESCVMSGNSHCEA
jgi:hypothetical protein